MHSCGSQKRSRFFLWAETICFCVTAEIKSTPLSQPAPFNFFQHPHFREVPRYELTADPSLPCSLSESLVLKGERLLRLVSAQFDGSIEWLFKWAVVPGLSGMSIKHMTEFSISPKFPFFLVSYEETSFFFFFNKSHSKSFFETCL